MSETNERSVASAGSVGEPVAWGVASHFRVLATSISRVDAVDMQSEYACDTHVVPLYRKPTLTDAEREAIEAMAGYAEGAPQRFNRGIAATLRGLLERLGGEK